VIAGGGYLQGTLYRVLAFHFIKIHFIAPVGFKKRPSIQLEGRDDHLAIEKIPCLPEIPHWDDLNPFNDGRFWSIRFRDDHPQPFHMSRVSTPGM